MSLVNIDRAFSTKLLSLAIAAVRKRLPDFRLGEVGLTWSGPPARRHYFFEYRKFYWEGRAASADDARVKGNVDGSWRYTP